MTLLVSSETLALRNFALLAPDASIQSSKVVMVLLMASLAVVDRRDLMVAEKTTRSRNTECEIVLRGYGVKKTVSL